MNRRHPRNIPFRPLVLIVDDHDDTRELYVASLAALGFDAIAAGDCARAYRQAWESHPDIVVTDLTLRDADGWQLIQDLKREPRTRGIPVVLLTGHAAPTLPDPTEREIKRHLRNRATEAMNTVEAARRTAPFLATFRGLERQFSSPEIEVFQAQGVAVEAWHTFLKHSRWCGSDMSHSPVPSMLIVDQPSQVYFPKQLSAAQLDGDAEPYKDEDVEAVRKIFTALSSAVVATGGRLQIIVLDHATDTVWGGVRPLRVAGQWRGGAKLVPDTWPGRT